jgi:hypothetical protein
MSSPSFPHDSLVELFANCPGLAAELVRDVLHYEVPAFERAEVRRAELTQLVPTEYRSDLVVVCHGQAGPAYAFIVEVQLATDNDKLYSWPFYAAAARARYRCPASVLVVTPDRAVARWAARPIETGAGWRFAPLVLGPETIPQVTDPDRAREQPELALLSIRAHGQGEHAEPIALAALAGIVGLPEERAKLYLEIIWHAVGQLLRQKLEATMIENYEYQSPWVKKWNRLQAEAEQAKAEATNAKAEATHAAAQNEARVLVRLIEKRGLALTEAQRTQIMACKDLTTLDGWADRVLAATSVDELLNGSR